MKNSIAKKTSNKAVKKPKVTKKKTKTNVVKKEYKVVIKLNDKVYKFKTNDIAASILSVKPEFLKTRVIIEVIKGKKKCERMLYLQRGKVLFNNRYALEALVRNLIF